MRFRIEFVAQRERPAYVFARQLEAGNFTVSTTSRLGGVPIKPYVSQPSALKPDGKPDLSVFTFVLATANDLAKLKVGQEAELSNADQ
jgi:hypothetical protein